MDGYTVEEAASVLGVPRERVWELIARGVLSGSTDLAGGMRVRLKADVPPERPPAPVEPPTNGGAGASDSSPFRELLTEFRSLTERYGQALLALGEARGEVASLRSRVDLLEARVDLRLPSASVPSPGWRGTPWPVPAEQVVEPRTRPNEEPAPGEQSDSSSTHRRRRGRRATESFAEALARADDPSAPELPGSTEAAAAFAALRGERADPHPDAAADLEASLPRDLPSAQAVLVAEEEPAAEKTAAAVSESVATNVPPAAERPAVASDKAAPAIADAPEPAAETSERRQSSTEQQAAPAPARPESGWDREHYSADVEEPDWVSADEVGFGTSGPRGGDEEPAGEPQRARLHPVAIEPEPDAPARDRATRSDLEPLAIEGAGDASLQEGLAALDALVNAPAVAAGLAEAEAPAERVQATPHDLHDEGRTWAPRMPPSRPAIHAAPFAHRSPASRAYRRLRRIFPA